MRNAQRRYTWAVIRMVIKIQGLEVYHSELAPGSVCVTVSQVPGFLPASPNFLSSECEIVKVPTPKGYYED